jgi:FkbM family methyltransferase
MSFWDLIFRAGSRIEHKAPRLGTRLMLAAARRNSEPEVHAMPALADHARISIDVGANWGLYTGTLLPLSRDVVGFEPNPVLAAQLRRAFPGTRIEGCALGATEGIARLAIPLQPDGTPIPGWATLGDHDFDRTDGVEVPVRRLDDFGFQGVGFIKIDVEGFEMQVLDGAAGTIARERPAMMIECSNPDPQPLVDRVVALGYRAGFWLGGAIRPFSEWHSGLVGWHGGPPNNLIFRPD